MNIHNLDEFTISYIDTALKLSHDERSGSDVFLSDHHDASELTSDALTQIVKECKEFQATLIATAAIESNGYTGPNHTGASTADLAGYFFWLTRNGHGSGFWDGRWGEWGDALDVQAKAAGERSLYLGDDNRIHYGRG